MLSGSPPEGSPRQCHARSMHTRQRCRKWALKGRDFCQFHGGRREVVSEKGLGKYGRHLGKTLRAQLAELASSPHHEQVELYEELALTRLAALDAIKLWEAAQKSKVDETKALAVSCLHDAMTRVREMCLAVTRIEKDSEDKVSLRVVDLLILQVVRAVHRVCQDDELAGKIEEEIHNTVRMPTTDDTTPGTDLTPDEVVREMDDVSAPEVKDDEGDKGAADATPLEVDC